MEWFVGEESICQNDLFPWFGVGGAGRGGFIFFYFFKNKVKIKILRLPNGVLFSMIAFLKIQRCCSQVTQVPKTSLLTIFFSFLFPFSLFFFFFLYKEKGGKTSFQSRPFLVEEKKKK